MKYFLKYWAGFTFLILSSTGTIAQRIDTAKLIFKTKQVVFHELRQDKIFDTPQALNSLVNDVDTFQYYFLESKGLNDEDGLIFTDNSWVIFVGVSGNEYQELWLEDTVYNIFPNHLHSQDTLVIAWIYRTEGYVEKLKSRYYYLLRGFRENDFIHFRNDLATESFEDSLAVDSLIRKREIVADGLNLQCLLSASETPPKDRDLFFECMGSILKERSGPNHISWGTPDSLSSEERFKLSMKYTTLFFSSTFRKIPRFYFPKW